MSMYPNCSSILTELIWLFNEPESNLNYLASRERKRYREGCGWMLSFSKLRQQTQNLLVENKAIHEVLSTLELAAEI